MLDKIANILQHECHLQADSLLVVGVSGGPDSLCLLHILNRLGYQLIVAHVNHKLRPESDREARYVENLTNALGMPFLYTEVDIHSYAGEHSLSIEEAARRVRYQFLYEQAKERCAKAVLVAHTANDQVETILMHLLRGSGLVGLAGMDSLTLPNEWSDRIPLIRPMLSSKRDEIMQYLQANQLVPLFDQSNLDTTYFRNRLRHELLPTLETYNPRIQDNLLRMSQILRDDYSVIQVKVDEAWSNCFAGQEHELPSFYRSAFRALPIALQRYLLRRAIAFHLPGLIDVGFEIIERGRRFVSEDRPGGRVDIIAGLWLICEGDIFWLAFDLDDLRISGFPAITSSVNITLEIPTTVILENGWQLSVEIPNDIGLVLPQSTTNKDPYQIWLDSDALSESLVLRSRKPGDRILPLGMEGHSMKISDLMINLKVPVRARKTWPLLCSGDQVLWVPGYRQSQHGRVTASSLSLVHMVLLLNHSS